MDYDSLVLRNAGYISDHAQARMRDTRVLIAGCGMGSVFAETAVRLEYEKLVLVDHDVVDSHNLNRQNFTAADVGVHKVDALAKRLLGINPSSEITIIREKISIHNADDIVSKSDLVFDTIDFLDLPGLVALHDACFTQNKKLLTAVNAGFGVAGLYFPEIKKCTIRDLFDLPQSGSVEGCSYGEKYAGFVQKIAHRLDPVVVEQFAKILKFLSEGKPCPAPQVAPGIACVAALAGTIAVRIAEDQPILEAPEMLIISMTNLVCG